MNTEIAFLRKIRMSQREVTHTYIVLQQLHVIQTDKERNAEQ